MHEILIKHYEAARQETIERIKLRQTIIILYLGFVGTVLGVAIDKNPKIAISIPIVSLGVSLIIRDHELLLGYLGQWLRIAYQKYLDSDTELMKLPQWDSSSYLQEYARTKIRSRFFGYGLFLLLGNCLGLIISLKEKLINFKSITHVSRFDLIDYFSIIITLFLVLLLYRTYQQRKNLIISQ